MDLIYAIIPVTEITQEMIDYCVQTRIDTLRKNIAGTEAILKWHSPTPQCLEDYTHYTHNEILAIIADPENGWQEAGP